jgi:hypothetical protein
MEKYYIDYHEKCLTSSHEYYQANKDKINLINKTIHICDCDGKFTHCHKTRHLKTKKTYRLY